MEPKIRGDEKVLDWKEAGISPNAPVEREEFSRVIDAAMKGNYRREVTDKGTYLTFKVA